MIEHAATWATPIANYVDLLLPTLTAKTFFILSIQLFITWAVARFTLDRIRAASKAGAPWVKSKDIGNGFIDMTLVEAKTPWYFGFPFVFLYIVSFLGLLWWGQFQPWPIALTLFSVWSVCMGVLCATNLISVNENLGSIVLAMTALIVLGIGLITQYEIVDLSSLSSWMVILLLGLILFNLSRLVLRIPRPVQRIVAALGVVLFSLYLLHDFNTLTKAQAAGVNSWEVALRIAIELYLDVINLFLQLLDALSD